MTEKVCNWHCASAMKIATPVRKCFAFDVRHIVPYARCCSEFTSSFVENEMIPGAHHTSDDNCDWAESPGVGISGGGPPSSDYSLCPTVLRSRADTNAQIIIVGAAFRQCRREQLARQDVFAAQG